MFTYLLHLYILKHPDVLIFLKLSTVVSIVQTMLQDQEPTTHVIMATSLLEKPTERVRKIVSGLESHPDAHVSINKRKKNYKQTKTYHIITTMLNHAYYYTQVSIAPNMMLHITDLCSILDLLQSQGLITAVKMAINWLDWHTEHVGTMENGVENYPTAYVSYMYNIKGPNSIVQ